jgi:hypothetical protein
VCKIQLACMRFAACVGPSVRMGRGKSSMHEALRTAGDREVFPNSF